MPRSRRTERPDEIGPWSQDKLDLLQAYLPAYSKIMNSERQRVWLQRCHYIDAFAGAVWQKPKTTKRGAKAQSQDLLWGPESVSPVEVDADVEQYIEGSPLRALNTEPTFDTCWFIDRSEWRLEQLNSLQKQFPDRDIRIRSGDCNPILRDEIATEITRKSKQRGVVFLDPYGLGVEWGTVVALANAQTFDIFINFSLMHVTRILKRDEAPDQSAIDLFNKVMGDSSWTQQLYKPPAQTSFLEDLSMVRDVMQPRWLAEIYADQLKQVFPYVTRSVIMYSSKNAPLYALLLASHNRYAVKIMNDIFAKYERSKNEGK